MKTVVITADFDGYPNGKEKRSFVVGQEPELSNDYAELLVSKGLARPPEGKTTKTEPPKGAQQKDADT